MTAEEAKTPKKKPESVKKIKSEPPKAPSGQLKIKLVRSLVGRPEKQRVVVRGLGLRRLNSEVICKDCPEIRGMVNKVSFLLEVKAVEIK